MTKSTDDIYEAAYEDAMKTIMGRMKTQPRSVPAEPDLDSFTMRDYPADDGLGAFETEVKPHVITGDLQKQLEAMRRERDVAIEERRICAVKLNEHRSSLKAIVSFLRTGGYIK